MKIDYFEKSIKWEKTFVREMRKRFPFFDKKIETNDFTTPLQKTKKYEERENISHLVVR